ALAAAFSGGCGADNLATISGTVTYDGEPVGDGMITFLPADGKGPASGGAIVDGKYSVSGLLSGLKIIKVYAVKAEPIARSSEDMEPPSADNPTKGDRTGIIYRAATIPPDADGNNAAYEVKPGKHTRDIELRKKSR